jgi:hypothetical protein
MTPNVDDNGNLEEMCSICVRASSEEHYWGITDNARKRHDDFFGRDTTRLNNPDND